MVMRPGFFPLPVLFFCALASTLAQVDPSAAGEHPAFSERVEEREKMVREGIENYPYFPVRDPKVLKAMRRVPRHLFVTVRSISDTTRPSPSLLLWHI